MPKNPLYEKLGDSLEPVRKPTGLEIAYFAGFFDGEGSATPNKNYKGVCVKLSQKDPELLYRMRDLWGGSVRFWATKSAKGSWIFEGYESYKNPIYVWAISGDRARFFLKQIYPYMSSRRKAQIDRIDLSPNGWMLRKSPQMSPERAERRKLMDKREKYLEGKAHHRETNLEHCREKDRQFQRNKFGYEPRMKPDAGDSQKELVN
jgi:hypothetical protein